MRTIYVNSRERKYNLPAWMILITFIVLSILSNWALIRFFFHP